MELWKASGLTEESMDAETLIRWTAETFGNKSMFACSFGAEDMVILHMIVRMRGEISELPEIVTLDTGRLHEETYALMQSVRETYDIEIRTLTPATGQLSEMVTVHGPNLFYKSVELRKLCCRVRKVIPLEEELESHSAWITGVRKEQSEERSSVVKIASDPVRPHLLKVNPLSDWSTQQLWDYIRQNNVPYNSLHDRGFPSIGCAPCTRAVAAGEDLRAGRWWWEGGKKECGIHTQSGDVHTGFITKVNRK